MKKLIVVIALLLITSVVYAGSLKPYTGGATPALELADLQGESHQLGDYKGQVVLVQFWATYCAPCRKEMPSMNRLQAKMGEDLKILAVNMGETQKEVEDFVAQVKPEFTILMDEAGKSISDWKAFVAPASFLVDREGTVKYVLYGAVEWDSDDMVATLQAL